MKATKEQLLKYKNPDPRCEYPFTPDAAGYCWSYAHHVDGTKGYKHMKRKCLHCEMWTESDKKVIMKEREEAKKGWEKERRHER